MSKLSKELIRQIIADGEFSTPNDIGEYLKDMFKDVIQEMLEKELALELGYEKGDSQNKNTDNRRNGYSKKTVKSQFGNIELDIPRDRNSEYNPKVIPKHTKNISGLSFLNSFSKSNSPLPLLIHASLTTRRAFTI